MELTMTQIENLLEAVDRLEQAKSLIQRGLTEYVEANYLCRQIDEVIIEIDRMGTEVELKAE